MKRMALGAAAAVIGIFIAYRVWVAKPGTSARAQQSLRPLYTLLFNKYYVDEAIDFMIVRPVRWLGAVSERNAERVIAQAAVMGSISGVVRIASAFVRSAQTGSVRAYAAVVSSGVGAILLYALVKR